MNPEDALAQGDFQPQPFDVAGHSVYSASARKKMAASPVFVLDRAGFRASEGAAARPDKAR